MRNHGNAVGLFFPAAADQILQGPGNTAAKSLKSFSVKGLPVADPFTS